VAESQAQIMGNFGNEGGSSTSESTDDPEDSELVKKAKKQPLEDSEYSWTFRDGILYNLGIGASEKELKYSFEGDDEFQILPTFGVVPQFATSSGIPRELLYLCLDHCLTQS